MAAAAAAEVRSVLAPAGGGAEGRKLAARSRRRAREGQEWEMARVEEKAAVVGSVAMARTRARRQAVRISGRMAALAGSWRGFLGLESESESERGDEDRGGGGGVKEEVKKKAWFKDLSR